MIGAASMGAVRAAELSRFGMVGVGLVYRWYRRWPLAPDDAVAVQSAPAELDFFPLTDAMVDLQMTFSSLMRRELITPPERAELTTLARNMNFRDRSIEAVLRAAGQSIDGLGAARQELVRQKRLDALSALRMAPGLVAPSARFRHDWTWIATNTFIRDLEAGGIDVKLLSTYS
jgi:hypothetical protein